VRSAPTTALSHGICTPSSVRLLCPNYCSPRPFRHSASARTIRAEARAIRLNISTTFPGSMICLQTRSIALRNPSIAPENSTANSPAPAGWGASGSRAVSRAPQRSSPCALAHAAIAAVPVRPPHPLPTADAPGKRRFLPPKVGGPSLLITRSFTRGRGSFTASLSPRIPGRANETVG
jgi:hypothetical protein